MTKKEIIKLRVQFLWDFHKYIIELGDEDIYLAWVEEGVPDEPDDDDMLEIAEDDALWVDTVEVFSRLTAEYE